MTHIVTTSARCEDAHHRAPRGVRPAGLATAALLLAAGCAAGIPSAENEPTTSDRAPQQLVSAPQLAVASLLLADEVPPAPPGSIVDSTGPVTITGDIGAPTRQVMTCTPLELPDGDDPGPAEPGAAGAASSSSVIGVAQVDQYAVVYVNEATAQDAVDRARELANGCDEAFAVHSPDSNAQATITPAPGTADAFQVHATYDAGGPATTSDETSAVLRSGRVVLFLRAAETGSGPNADQEVDGTLDPEWARQLIVAAAANLVG
jgi:hypothetical protein